MKEFIRSQWRKAARSALHRALIQSEALSVDLGRDYDFLLDLREAADYGGVAEASLASATKANPPPGRNFLAQNMPLPGIPAGERGGRWPD